MNKNYILKTNEYFEAFSSKDLNKLSEIYSDGINLIDWDGTWIGKEAVLNTNQILFHNAFELQVLDSVQCGDKTFNTLLIEIDGNSIEVMDVIKFNKDFQIEYIRAYRG